MAQRLNPGERYPSMIVDLIAYTVLVPDAIRRMGYDFHPPGTVTPGDELAEIAGRECYQAWLRKNPATATNYGYLNNILDKGHESILEHANYTFSIRGVSRSLTHELIRHRHFSYSMLSQRYVDESNGGYVLPPAIVDMDKETLELLLLDAHQEALNLYERVTNDLTEAGVPRKRARQAARYVLPNGHQTRLVVTGNVRAWREFVGKRAALHPESGEPLADLEIYDLATKILRWLQEMVPNSVQDITDKEPTAAA